MLDLLHDWDSVCSFKVRMCLAEKGLPWRSRRVELLRFEHLQPDYLALNPNGVVPALIDAGEVVIESSIMNEYLDETRPVPALIPADPRTRARMRVWVKYQDDVLYHAQRPATFQLMVKRMLAALTRDQIDALVAAHPQPERARHFLSWATGPVDAQVVTEARTKVEQVIARLDAALAAGPWLAGASFSLAECAYAPFVHRLERLRFDALWQDRPRVRDWVARIKSRPSYAASIGPAEFQMAAPADD